MHMADALISPVVGGAFWVISGTLIGYSARKIAQERDNTKIPLMGVLGAFVFAAQMINFSIPGTGSSGHLGGGLLLAALLGPYRSFITIASVLTIQCLFFADGGVLALGCNMFNLGFFPAFIAYPLLFKGLSGKKHTDGRLLTGSIIAADAGIMAGSFSVVLQTVFSGVSELPFSTFILFMLPIHFGIGIVEGLVTWGILSFVNKTEPALLVPARESKIPRTVIVTFAVAALIVGGVISWFASSSPDGLEWSIFKVAGVEQLSGTASKIHNFSAFIQEKIAFLPDYSFKAPKSANSDSQIHFGTSFAGLVGSLLVLLMAGILGLALRRRMPSPQTNA